MFTHADLDGLASIFSDPLVMKYLGTGEPVSREETETALTSIIRHWHRHGFGRWAVVHKEDDSLIGYGGLRWLEGVGPELVYLLAQPYWGMGLATEIARACLRYGFELRQFDSIVAIAKPPNIASRRVMEKVGMSYEKQATYFNIDVVQYTISRDQYRPDDLTYILHDVFESEAGSSAAESSLA